MDRRWNDDEFISWKVICVSQSVPRLSSVSYSVRWESRVSSASVKSPVCVNKAITRVLIFNVYLVLMCGMFPACYLFNMGSQYSKTHAFSQQTSPCQPIETDPVNFFITSPRWLGANSLLTLVSDHLCLWWSNQMRMCQKMLCKSIP